MRWSPEQYILRKFIEAVEVMGPDKLIAGSGSGVASLLSKIGKEELASAFVRWVPSSSSCAMVAGTVDFEEIYRGC